MKEFFSPFEDNLSTKKDGHTIGFILTVDEAGHVDKKGLDVFRFISLLVYGLLEKICWRFIDRLTGASKFWPSSLSNKKHL